MTAGKVARHTGGTYNYIQVMRFYGTIEAESIQLKLAPALICMQRTQYTICTRCFGYFCSWHNLFLCTSNDYQSKTFFCLDLLRNVILQCSDVPRIVVFVRVLPLGQKVVEGRKFQVSQVGTAIEGLVSFVLEDWSS